MAHEVLHVHPPDDPGLGGLAGIVAVVTRQGRCDGGHLVRFGLGLGFRFGRGLALLGFGRGGLVVHLGIGLLHFIIIIIIFIFLVVIFFIVVFTVIVRLIEQIRRGPVELLLLVLLGPAPYLGTLRGFLRALSSSSSASSATSSSPSPPSSFFSSSASLSAFGLVP